MYKRRSHLLTLLIKASTQKVKRIIPLLPCLHDQLQETTETKLNFICFLIASFSSKDSTSNSDLADSMQHAHCAIHNHNPSKI